MSIALLIADDHELVRDGLRQTFVCRGINVVGEASTVDAARRLALDEAVDVMLLDLSWRQESPAAGDGFDLLGEIRVARPLMGIVVYSIHDRPDYIDHCRRLGANGYLVKGVDDRQLVTAVHAAYAGEQYWPLERRRSARVLGRLPSR